MNCFRWRKKKR